MKFGNFDLKMFEAAKKEAEKSDFDRFHVGAVITYGHRIIGRGHNSDKTHPLQEHYNTLYRTFNNDSSGVIKHSIHAEIKAISSIPFVIGKEIDFNKASIYVYRICKKKPYGNSRPCSACMAAIKDLGIRNVYYTSDFGLSYLELY